MARNYVTRLTDEQVAELMKCYAENYTDINIEKRDEDYISVELTVNDLPEYYEIYDYTVIVYDWQDSGKELLLFRKKMLEFFGNQYAVDYLLSDL